MRGTSLLIFSLLATPLAAQTPGEMPPNVSVNAVGSSMRDPDQAMLMLAVESEGTTARQAAQANAAKMDRLVGALRDAGLTGPAVRTTSYSIEPQYDYQRENGGPPRIVGYRAMNMVQVTIDDVTRVGAIVDLAVEAGSNRIAGLSFQLKDAEAAHLDAVGEATRRARLEAETVARALGMRLGEVMSISTSGYMPAPPPRPMYDMRAEVAMASAPTPIEAGSVEVSAHVSAVFRLVPNN